jgi:hypothetical protein
LNKAIPLRYSLNCTLLDHTNNKQLVLTTIFRLTCLIKRSISFATLHFRARRSELSSRFFLQSDILRLGPRFGGEHGRHFAFNPVNPTMNGPPVREIRLSKIGVGRGISYDEAGAFIDPGRY